MKTFMWLSFVVVLFSCVLLSQAAVPPEQIEALVKFYKATGGPGWTDSTGWPEGDPCDNSWFGVTCDTFTVTGLSLQNNELNGTIPDTISGLTQVEVLQFWNNNLSGTLPSFADLTSLQVLDCHNNSLTGTMPQISNSIEHLDFNLNQMEGTIPSDFSSYYYLQYLGLNMNHFHGNLSVLTGLNSLNTLMLSNNNFDGQILDVLVSLPGAIFLDGDGNKFSGTIPESIGSLVDLQYLSLVGNRISGSIPESIGQLTQLQNLILTDNYLMNQSSLPVSLTNLTSLENLFLDGLGLIGHIPYDFGSQQPNLVQLDLQFNSLNGFLPPSLGYAKNLKFLNVGENSLTGVVPVQICSLPGFSNGGLFTISANLFWSLPDQCCTLAGGIDWQPNYNWWGDCFCCDEYGSESGNGTSSSSG